MTGATAHDDHMARQDAAQAAAIARANALQNSSRFSRMLEEGMLTPQQEQDLEIARQAEITAEVNRMLAGDRDSDRMGVAIDASRDLDSGPF